MIKKTEKKSQVSMFFSLKDTLDQKHPLFILAEEIDWQKFEDAFRSLYCSDNGRPALPIRLMVGLLILKHLRNISDESVVEQYSENVYYQYLCGKSEFVAKVPCEASELVHFRNRIGEQGIELILKESIRINGDDRFDPDVNIDTTVQEKNITFPTDNKLHRKIITKCKAISEKEDLPVRQSYIRTLKKLSVAQRFRNHPKNYRKARKADRKVKTIAGRLVRELERNLEPNSQYQRELALFNRVLTQKKDDKHKVYTLHEPEVECISKGKESKKYEFGNKENNEISNTNVILTSNNQNSKSEIIRLFKSGDSILPNKNDAILNSEQISINDESKTENELEPLGYDSPEFEYFLTHRVDYSDYKSHCYNNILVILVNIRRAVQKESMFFYGYLQEEIGKGYKKIVLDMTTIEFIDSNYAGVLISCKRISFKLGGKMKLVMKKYGQYSNPIIQQGLEKNFDIYRDLKDAIESY